MARRGNWRRIKRHRNYTVDEVARMVGISKATVRRWIKIGALRDASDRKPALILGDDLIDFLAGRRKPKQKCRLHECYCFACRRPQPPAFAEVEYFALAASSGNMRALCATCTNIMHKRVSASRLGELGDLVRVTIREGVGDLADMPDLCLIVHQAKEPQPHA